MTDIRRIVCEFFDEILPYEFSDVRNKHANRLIERLEQATPSLSYDDGLRRGAEIAENHYAKREDPKVGSVNWAVAQAAKRADESLTFLKQVVERKPEPLTIAEAIRAEIGKPASGISEFVLPGTAPGEYPLAAPEQASCGATSAAIEAVEKLRWLGEEDDAAAEGYESAKQDAISALCSLPPEPARPDPVEVIKRHIDRLSVSSRGVDREACLLLEIILLEIEPSRQDSEVAG